MDPEAPTLPTPLAPLRDRIPVEGAAPPKPCLQRPHSGTPEHLEHAANVELMRKRYEQGRDLRTGERLTSSQRRDR